MPTKAILTTIFVIATAASIIACNQTPDQPPNTAQSSPQPTFDLQNPSNLATLIADLPPSTNQPTKNPFLLVPADTTPATVISPAPQVGSQPIDLGPSTAYISPKLWVILQKHSDGEIVPLHNLVEFGFRTDIPSTTTLEEAIFSAGGTQTAQFTYRIPTTTLLTIIQRPDVINVAHHTEDDGTPDPYPKMNDILKDVATAYAGGIAADNAAQYALYIHEDKILVALISEDDTTTESIRGWLTQNNIYVLPASEFASAPVGFLATLLPVEYLVPLSTEYPNTFLNASTQVGQGLPLSRIDWPPQAQDYEREVVNQYLPNETPKPANVPTNTIPTNPAPTTTVPPTDLPQP